ncbi:MAG: hypothetical protein QOH42_1194 [Blastocatellia bacterium]|nr:hypothetical protein [Blastocatellia bacterium]
MAELCYKGWVRTDIKLNREELQIMLRRLAVRKTLLLVLFCLTALALTITTTTVPNAAADFTGREILSVTRIAHGGPDYAGLQNVTVQASGFVNAAAFGGLAANPLGAVAEVKLRITDYQDKQMRRRLDVAPIAALGPGPTFLVFTGSQGGGMMMGNEFRVRETAVSRHWAMMGFDTLNRAIEGSLVAVRQADEGGDYVVEVKFNSDDTVRYWINKQTFLIDKITTRYRSQVLIEEQRSDYRRADCMMLPFHVITRLQGQTFADLDIVSYDVKSNVPASRFTITATP